MSESDDSDFAPRSQRSDDEAADADADETAQLLREERAEFLDAPEFEGAKPGYAFRLGPRGQGYYREGGAAGGGPDVGELDGFAVGERVEAPWPTDDEGYYYEGLYPATVRAVNGDGTYALRYDDGEDLPVVQGADMKPLQPPKKRRKRPAGQTAGEAQNDEEEGEEDGEEEEEEEEEEDPELKAAREEMEADPEWSTRRAEDGLEPMEPPKGMLLELLPFQKEALGWLSRQEKSEFRGGILADEMGMGKTIETVSVILKNKPVKNKPVKKLWDDCRTVPAEGLVLSRATLVIAPVAAMLQWQTEIDKYCEKGSLKVLPAVAPAVRSPLRRPPAC